MKKEKITIGARGSKLSLIQADWVTSRLKEVNPGLEVELIIIKTKGDKILDAPLAKVGGKGLFVKEIEDALIDGRADLAVHSMKDVPTVLPPELYLAVIPEREDFRDALVSARGLAVDDLPPGAVVGTSSLRRQAQLLYRRPDLKIVPLRGNVDTRLAKLESENLDAVVLAAAGLRRMNLADRIDQLIEPDLMLPAVGQGALGLEIRREDPAVLELIQPLRHDPTAVCVRAERAFLKTLEGGCQVPLAALARLEENVLSLDGLVADPEGRRYFRGGRRVDPDRAEEAGTDLARDLLAQGGRQVLAEVYEC